MHCAALNCTTQQCTALHCTAMLFNFQRCPLLHCTPLHYTILHCITLHNTALKKNCTVLHCTAFHCIAMHFPVLHCTAPYDPCYLWGRFGCSKMGSGSGKQGFCVGHRYRAGQGSQLGKYLTRWMIQCPCRELRLKLKKKNRKIQLSR